MRETERGFNESNVQVVLMHDIHPGTIEMVTGMNGLVMSYVKKGYKFISLDELDLNRVRATW